MCHKWWNNYSAYLFILVFEILFLFIKKHPEIKGIEIFEHCFLYTPYADDTTFFLKDAQSIENLVEIFNTFSLFSGLKPNLVKCEISGIGAMKGVQVAVCGMRCINFCNEAIKILGTYFSYNSKIKEECNFLKIVSNVQSALNLWRYQNLTLEGRIVVFKNLAISKIFFQTLIAPVPTDVIKALETIQTTFLWNNSNSKIKYKTLCKRYENRGLKNIEIQNKVNSPQSS